MDNIARKQEKELASDVKQRLSDIIMKITWREVAHDYFHKSASWLYHKLDGINGMGAPGGFTESELLQLKEGLIDLSEKIRAAADRL